MISGIGSDIARIERFSQALERHGPRFAKRILGPLEQARYPDGAPPAAFLAKRFAAKEAFVKALGTGLRHGMCWSDIQVVNDDRGKPGLQLSGQAEVLYQAAGITGCHLSLSDEDAYALAFVVLECAP
ncbi:holo-ACP synthase [Vreelandella rituensis]|uniref:Holo-[acyl-carrier-protein] synthase n=1 Tax=Vreelandella rituensis TaxID=2282306 RepID=A0A368U2I2_9GAMM|nr:holo-ACP synthase [Halomonas rituensis]RCV89323.1 holo-ACP synthase [Halomonas rituensis]